MAPTEQQPAALYVAGNGQDPPVEEKVSPYVPAHEFYTSLPHAPHPLLVPALALSDTQRDQLFSIEPPVEHDFEVGEFVGPDFFNQVDPFWFAHRAPTREMWAYSWRREAQQIMPFLYLGPSSVLKDSDFLRREGITLLLCIRDKRLRLVSGDKAAQDLGIQADSIDVEGDSELIASYSPAIRRINQHLVSGATAQQELPPRVLVFCEGGNERSASVVIAYLMVMLNKKLLPAIWAVQHRRFCINIDETRQSILQSFESILDAKRQVTRARRQEVHNPAAEPFPHSQSQLSRKRSFVEFNDAQQPTSGLNANAQALRKHTSTTEDNSEHIKQMPAPFIDRIA